MKERILYLLICLSVTSTLINNDYFESYTVAAYFSYVITSSVLNLLTGIVYIKYKQTIALPELLPITSFVLLTIYYLSQNFFIKQHGLNIMHFLLLTNCLLLISYCILFRIVNLDSLKIYKIIILLASLESVICLLQFFGLYKSESPYFTVTGTWVNPNVSAIFLAMTYPIAILFYFKGRLSKHNIYIFPLLLITIALLLLKCRTAFIGIVVSSVIILISRNNFLQYIKTKYSRAQILLLGLITITIICIGGIFLYQIKQSSSEGRKLVWKVSANAVMQNFLIGCGYGRFEHDYNLAQAAYFANNKDATEEEKNNAAFTNMAYNEFLQNAVEGGIIAFVILSLFFISVLYPLPEQILSEHTVAYSAIAAFVVMSIFNFTIQAIPAMCLFVIYVAIIASSNTKKISLQKMYDTAKIKIPVSIVLIISSIYLLISQVQVAQASAKSKNVSYLIKRKSSNAAATELSKLEDKLNQSYIYWLNFGNALFHQKSYPEAIKKFQNAILLKSNPEAFIQLALCYHKLGNNDSAIAMCTLAQNIAPSRLTPRFALMQIYSSIKDTANTLLMANEIIMIRPKVESKEADFYKTSAKKMIEQFKIQK